MACHAPAPLPTVLASLRRQAAFQRFSLRAGHCLEVPPLPIAALHCSPLVDGSCQLYLFGNTADLLVDERACHKPPGGGWFLLGCRVCSASYTIAVTSTTAAAAAAASAVLFEAFICSLAWFMQLRKLLMLLLLLLLGLLLRLLVRLLCMSPNLLLRLLPPALLLLYPLLGCLGVRAVNDHSQPIVQGISQLGPAPICCCNTLLYCRVRLSWVRLSWV